MRDNRNEIYKNFMRVAKRVTITILCCIPLCAVFAYATRNIINSDFLQILGFMLIMGLGVLIVETIARKREKKKQEQSILETKKDVFK